MQQPANMSGAPVIVAVQTASIRTRRRYIPVTSEPAQEFKRLGVAHVVIGAVCIFLQLISLGCADSVSAISCNGVWIGTQFIVTGVFGIYAGRTGRKCQGIVGTVLESLIALLAIAEGIVAIRSSVIGCMIGACCCKCGGSCCCPTDSQYQQLHNSDEPDLTQQQSYASSQQEPTFSTNQDQPVLNQHQQQLMFNPSQKQLVLNPNHQPPLFNPSQQQHIFNPNQQQPTFNPNQQLPMFNPNQQVPVFNPNQQQLIFLSTQPNVGFYPQHQAVQYYALQPITASGSHQTDVSTNLSGATSQGQFAGSLTGPIHM